MSEGNTDRGVAWVSPSNELYRSVVNALEEGVLVRDFEGRVVAYNDSALRALGLSAAQLLGTAPKDPLWRVVHADGTPFAAEDHPMAVTLRTGATRSRVIMGIHLRDEEVRWLSVTSRAVAPGADHPPAVVITLVDVTESRRAERALADANEAVTKGLRLFEQMAKLSASSVYVLDYRRRAPIFSNRDAAQALGYSEDQVRELGPRFADHIAHPDDAQIVAQSFADLATLADGAVIELITRVRHASGQWRWVVRRETVLSRYPDGSPREIGGNAFDITELKEAELRLETLARTDSLTGLANIRVIKERLTIMLAECGRGRRIGLLMLDIDNFKHLNDSYGHGAGDTALREVGRLLQSNVRATDLAGRYGGEEFCVLLADVDEPSALLVADKLRRALHAIQVPCPVTASFGVTLLSAADQTIEESLERADRALYAAKKNGRDRIEVGAAPPAPTIRWRSPTNPD